MSEVSMQIVREFFELNLFYVLPHWRFESQDGKDPEGAGSLLFVEQPRMSASSSPDFLLGGGDIKSIHRAVVEVRAWHADRLYPSVIESNSLFSRIASQQTRLLAENVFNTNDYKIILVVSELSNSPSAREQSLQSLRSYGINHVIEFPMILSDLLRLISAQGNYAPSHTLQTMRLLKRYGFLRQQQMELFFPTWVHDAQANVPLDPELSRPEKRDFFSEEQDNVPEEDEAEEG